MVFNKVLLLPRIMVDTFVQGSLHLCRSVAFEARSSANYLCIERAYTVGSHLVACIASKSLNWSIGKCQFQPIRTLYLLRFVNEGTFMSFSFRLLLLVPTPPPSPPPSPLPPPSPSASIINGALCRFVSVPHWFERFVGSLELTFCFNKYWLLASSYSDECQRQLVNV